MLLKPFMIKKHKVYTSASIGIVLSKFKYASSEEVLRDADIAMYQAKLLGKARYVLFEVGMRKQVVSRLELENDLRHALERDQLDLNYQPIISLRDDRIVGFEALLRWVHPEKGLIMPREFITVAEETGLIFSLGSWVLRKACLQMRRWQDRYPSDPPLIISVNLSIRQFEQSDLADQVVRILSETGLKPSSLCLELTENMIMGDGDTVHEHLNRLQKIGIRILIDDFGTGYSSLGYLQRYPIDTLKIDYSFINQMGNDGDRSEIVRTILVLARELGMDTIAEGIESQCQLSQLKNLNCEFGQGFFISRPVNQPDAETQLQAQYNLLVEPNLASMALSEDHH
jgi:EAL domain-containing protein (putative c-di-GMP-specific phosphodiesterase class I)